MGQVRSAPCNSCKYEHQDKNRDECKGCEARLRYAHGLPAEPPVFDEPEKEKAMNKKTCEVCGIIKPADLVNFGQASRAKDGLTKACKAYREKAVTDKPVERPAPADVPVAEKPPVVVEKQCGRCGETFPANPEYFCKSKRNADGLSGRCKACESKRKRLSKGRREVFVDLTEFPSVWEKLEDTARDQLRTVEDQAAWIVMEALR